MRWTSDDPSKGCHRTIGDLRRCEFVDQIATRIRDLGPRPCLRASHQDLGRCRRTAEIVDVILLSEMKCNPLTLPICREAPSASRMTVAMVLGLIQPPMIVGCRHVVATRRTMCIVNIVEFQRHVTISRNASARIYSSMKSSNKRQSKCLAISLYRCAIA